MPAAWRTEELAWPSRAVGASRRTLPSPGPRSYPIRPLPGRRHLPDQHGDAGQHALEFGERLPDVDARRAHGQLAQGVLVGAAPLLDHRDRLPHPAAALEETEEEDAVGE